jgi:DNA-binding NtrC family response regulator/tetratricopeptide (TPR) repeat protein
MAAPTLSLKPPACAFVDLDDRVLAGNSGVVLISAPSVEVAEAAGAHVARRAQGSGPVVFVPRPRGGAPLFRNVQAELGLGSSCDVSACAAELAQLQATLIVPLAPAGSWDRAVTLEIVRRVAAPKASSFSAPSPAPLLVLFSTDVDRLVEAADCEVVVFDLREAMSPEARHRWFAAVAERACFDSGASDLASLESSFAGLRRRIGEQDGLAHAAPSSAAGAEALLASLELLGRAWPLDEIGALTHDLTLVHHLRDAGALSISRGLVSIDASAREGAEALAAEAGPELLRGAAGLLRARFEGDAWAMLHRAGLLLRAGEYLEGDREFASSMTLANDPLARRELVDRWAELLASLPPVPKLELAMKEAERALLAGRAEEAHRWAEVATQAGGDDPRVALLLGRASLAMGDLVAASVAFERGLSKIDGRAPDLTLLFEVEQAEVAYLRGSLDHARDLAASALARASEVACRLEARNTLGKILLARAAWEEADKHFEEDAWLASSSGLVTAELRARCNRAITLLSRGLMDKARSLFESVLAEGERKGETRACAFALDNLAVVASHQHQYAACLELWERAYKVRMELGDRAALTHVFRNLGYIRMKLGLWEHAEHAITFGRAMLGPGTPVSSSAYFALCAARVALLRGRTMQARREAMAAIPESRISGDKRCLAEAHRLMARIELEEGDLVRAREAIELARESQTTEEGRAELAVLEVHLARAQGEIDPDLALRALSAARLADDEQLLIEAETLASELYRAGGELDAARRHLDQGFSLRDQVAGTLPEHIRQAYLSRPDSIALDRARSMLEASPQAREGGLAWGDGAAPPSVPPESLPPRSLPRPEGGAPALGRLVVGNDPNIKSLLSAVRKVAVANCTVLIRGESGTGKELVARAVHMASDRACGPLVTVNCAALVETLLLSELFGHEKGAFTGAAARRRGRFELAEGGTLFLDEIGDISARTQVALLRVLQDRTFERVGGAVPIRVDVRILCATHRDLKAMVDRGEFRQDLYYRLRGVTLDVPPLRMRMGDLPLISDHLLGRIAVERGEEKKTLSPEALALLTRHRWPGNVRELENALRAASLFAEGAEISASDLVSNVDDLRTLSESRPSSLPGPLHGVGDAAGEGPSGGASRGLAGSGPSARAAGGELATNVAYAQVRGGVASLSDIKRQIERDCIARALAETKGNITRAAILLGMKRPRLSQLVKHYGLLAASSSEGS